MKNYIINISLFIASLVGGTSCQSWLDVKPEGAPNTASYWTTEHDFSEALVAVYKNLDQEETFGRDLFWEQGASDDVFYSRARGPKQMNLANLDMDGVTESSIKDIYSMMYEMMARANDVIYHGLQKENQSQRIRQHVGEAFFLRAFAHYMIAYRYGRIDNGVPFIRYEELPSYNNSLIPPQRASVTDNYQLIIEDLDKAIERLPYFQTYSRDDYGRASKDAALALKVKTYAYWAQHDPSKWSLIPSLVDKLENEANRGLHTKFADAFTIANEWGKEYIWSINSHSSTLSGSIFPGILLDNKGWGKVNGWGNFKPTLELYAEYADNDERRSATILAYGDSFMYFGESRQFYSSADLECGFHFNKYMDAFRQEGTASKNGNRPVTDLNVPIIRFAEMLLFKAEALIEQGKGNEAATVLNRISSRAGLGNLYTNATIQDLMHERRCELAGEFTDRVMDLKRWAAKYPEAKAKLEAAKHGLKYLHRDNPNSPLDEANGKAMTINGKLYKGVIEIMPAKEYNADKDCVLPYDKNEVIRSKGLLKQNKNY